MKILYVDDESDFLEQTKVFLEREEELSVDTVISVAKGLDLLEENSYDAVVSDYQMPEMDGLEFLETLREDKEIDIPFIIFTGKGREAVAMEALNLGADRYLQKGGSPKSQYGVLAQAIVQEVEHHVARRELRESEERHRAVFENTGTATVIIEGDTTLSLVNDKFEELSGYSKEEIEGRMSWTDFVTEEYLSKMKEYHDLRREKDKRPPNMYEFDFKDREGNIKRILLTIGIISGTKKTVASLLDITERKKTERELQRYKEKYKAIFDRSRDGVYIHDFEGTFLDANPVALDMIGYDKEEIESLCFLDLLSEDEVARTSKILEELLETGTQKKLSEFKLKRKDGEKIWVQTQSSLLYREGEPYAVHGIARDVTERKGMEEELRKSEEKYRAITEKSHDAIFIIGGVNLLFVNKRACELTGYSKEELYDLDWLDLLHPKDRERIMEIDKRGREGEKVPTKYESRILTKDGEVKYGDFRVTPIEYEGELAILGTVRDITARKKGKEKLRQYMMAVEGSKDLMAACDEDYNYLFANQSYLEYYQLDRGEISDYTLEDVIGKKEFSDTVKSKVDKCLKGEVIEYEMVRDFPQKGERNLFVSYYPFKDSDDGSEGMVAVLRDITERKEIHGG